MAAPNFYLEGTLPLKADSEHRLNQKILASIRAQVGEGAVSDEDLINLANLSGTGILTRVGVGDWRGRTLIPPSSGFFIDNGSGVGGDPTFRLDNTIGSPPYIKGILSAMESTGSAGGMAVLDQTVSPPFGPSLSKRTLVGTLGVSVTDGSGVSGNPTIALNINGMTEATTPDDDDYLAIYDISDGDHNKIRRRDLLVGLTATATVKSARVSCGGASTQLIPRLVHTARIWDVEDFDTDTIADVAGLPTRLTCKTAGQYFISATILWLTDATVPTREIRIRKNGSELLALARIGLQNEFGPEMHIETIAQLAVNDYVEITAWHDSDVSQILQASNHFEMIAYA